MKSRQIVFTEPLKAELLEIELPEPGSGELLLETLYTVISAGTERAVLTAMPNTVYAFPAKLGYCGVSRVLEMGEAVEGLAIGDRVLVYHGVHAAHCVARAGQLTKVEDEKVQSLEAAFVVIAAMSLGGVRKTRLELGESALIMGQGLLGLFATQLACIGGAVPVIVADPRADLRALALALGAELALNPGEAGFAEAVKAATSHGRGVNTVVEVTGVSAAMRQALECCAPQARVSLLGCTRVSDCAVDYYPMVHRPGISLIGAHNFVRPKQESYPYHWTHQDDCAVLLRLISAGRLKVLPMVSEVLSPEVAPEIYKRLANDPGFPVGVVFDWSEAH